MAVVKWSPFSEMEALHNEMNRLFSRFNAFPGFSSGFNGGGVANDQSWILPIDVVETPESLKVKASLPGIEPRNVNVEVTDNVLTISAERRHEEKVEQDHYQWIEQQYGTFSRSVTLPKTADTQNIEARYNNGVLELTVPKRESAKPRRIELAVGASAARTLEAGAAPQDANGAGSTEQQADESKSYESKS